MTKSKPPLAALTPAALRRLRRHILSIARKAEEDAYRTRMAALRAKRMALPPRGKRARPDE